MPEAPSLQPDEQALVARSQRGDLQAFNAIVEAYQKQVYNLALRMLGDQASAEDTTQDAFISAFRHINSFRGGSLRAWLLKIVANACRDLMRSAHQRRNISLEALTLTSELPFPSREESPEDYAMRSEMGQEIQRGLDAMPPDQRLVVILVDVQGLSYEEAARAAGASLGTIKSRLSRGRAHLRDFLRGKGELLPPEYRQEV